MEKLNRRDVLRMGMAGLLASLARPALGMGLQASAATQPSVGLEYLSMDLFQTLAGQDSTNAFLSPLSIAEALAMLAAGARGETADEIYAAMKIDAESLPRRIAAINQILASKDRQYQVSLANAVWVEAGYPLRDEFRNILETDYLAAGHSCDFQRNAARERQRINAWVSEKTSDKIKDLMPPESITPLTRLVLTNAIYFNAEWADYFDERQTQQEDFRLVSGQTVKADLMHNQFSGLQSFEDDELQAIDLPYKGESASMLVLLPRKADGIAALQKSLTAQTLSSYVDRLSNRTVRVTLPRFKLESSYDLVPALRAMGVNRIFSESQADFSGISERARSDRLHVSAAVHKAYVDVNEKRTEAAGATGMGMALTAVIEPMIFRADHPFLFAIRDRRSGQLLFVGRVGNPAAG